MSANQGFLIDWNLVVHYKYRIISPEDGATLWRYMSLEKFVNMLETKSLFFTRADKFEDPFEGFIPSALALHIAQAIGAETFVTNIQEALSNIKRAAFNPIPALEKIPKMNKLYFGNNLKILCKIDNNRVDPASLSVKYCGSLHTSHIKFPSIFYTETFNGNTFLERSH